MLPLCDIKQDVLIYGERQPSHSDGLAAGDTADAEDLLSLNVLITGDDGLAVF